MDFSVATKAGITQTELAQVLGVSRVTINLWLHGKMKPHRLHAERVGHRMKLLGQAITHNLIPEPRKNRKARHEEITKVLDMIESGQLTFI